MDTGRRLPLPALLLPLACAALAQRTLTEKQRACLLPPDDGPCRAMVPRWYYDRHTQSCQEFTYGGCYGNANNFLTFDDCEKNCWTIKTGPLLCYSPKDEGLCSSSVPRYYYDAKTKSCKEFNYTGCGGNANNFVTEMDCYNVCRKDICICLPERGELMETDSLVMIARTDRFASSLKGAIPPQEATKPCKNSFLGWFFPVTPLEPVLLHQHVLLVGNQVMDGMVFLLKSTDEYNLPKLIPLFHFTSSRKADHVTYPSRFQGEVLQPYHFCDPPLDLLDQIHVFTVVRTPELDAVLQVESHQREEER
ncbi:hypothetical protein WISP_119423 [Willisornis vidua]|uniref:BPTI/Kunitz inhibitor domain-containing protein n=1 Tax=Willisornis vidua TaxID=1566151 RepID=A0ABQ9CXE1_9PASS|nr:hypothetical protein WISP_119423 [Willisornis vidua]